MLRHQGLGSRVWPMDPTFSLARPAFTCVSAAKPKNAVVKLWWQRIINIMPRDRFPGSLCHAADPRPDR